MIAQIIYIILFIISLCIAANKHGKTESKTNNFWTSLIAYLISAGLLYWGGFFDVIISKF